MVKDSSMIIPMPVPFVRDTLNSLVGVDEKLCPSVEESPSIVKVQLLASLPLISVIMEAQAQLLFTLKLMTAQIAMSITNEEMAIDDMTMILFRFIHFLLAAAGISASVSWDASIFLPQQSTRQEIKLIQNHGNNHPKWLKHPMPSGACSPGRGKLGSEWMMEDGADNPQGGNGDSRP